MYLIHEDDELAAQAFARSQAIDPENAVAWIGQAILAVRSNDPLEAHELYQHAFEIGERSLVLTLHKTVLIETTASYRFAEVTFDQASTHSVSHVSFPSAPLYALRTYLVQQKDDIYALHMMSLLLERDGQLDAAADTLYRLSEILEQQYEEFEDLEILEKFCIVKSDIARVCLGLDDFETAVDSGLTALDLSQNIDTVERARLSSQIVVGLGYYFLGKLEDAIDVFQKVLTESDEDVDVMVLVAKALWSVGGDQEREIAIQQIHDWYAGP
jgi:superkiller protein 3